MDNSDLSSYIQACIRPAEIRGKRVLGAGAGTVPTLRTLIESMQPGQFEVTNGHELPQKTRSAAFDVVIATGLLGTAEDVSAAIAGLKELLAPGGILLMITPALGYEGREAGGRSLWQPSPDDLLTLFDEYQIEFLYPDLPGPRVLIKAQKPRQLIQTWALKHAPMRAESPKEVAPDSSAELMQLREQLEVERANSQELTGLVLKLETTLRQMRADQAQRLQSESERASQQLAEISQAQQLIHELEQERERLLSETAAAQQSLVTQDREIQRLNDIINAINRTRLWRLAGYIWRAANWLRGIHGTPPWAPENLTPGRGRTMPTISTADGAPASRIDVDRPGTLDIVCLGVISWEFRYQRPQQLMARFAHHHHHVYYVRPDQFAARGLAQIEPVIENLWQIRPAVTEGFNLHLQRLNPLDADEAARSILGVLRAEGIGPCVLVVQHPAWMPVAGLLKHELGCQLIYDCMDDFSGFAVKVDRLDSMETALLAISDLVSASSKLLYDRLSREHPRVVLIPNAGDYEHFAATAQARPALEIESIPGPIIGYYGAIAEWFDVDALAAVAHHQPGWNFVLIGATTGCPCDALAALPNVHFLGEKPYQALPRYLTHFDVSLIPFKRNALTESTNPVKLFEYLSAGKPVVARRLPEVEPYADVISLYETGPELEWMIQQELAAASDAARRGERQRRGFENTWDRRYSALYEALTGLFGKVSIIMITFHNLELTRKAIESIFSKTEYPNFELLIVDNGSGPELIQYLRELAACEPRVRVIFNGENRGFAAANNIGFEATRDSDYVVLLNDDVVVTRGWLSTLIGHLQDPLVGMVGPVTNSIGNEAKIDIPYSNIAEMPAFAHAYTSQRRGSTFEIKVLAMFCAAIRRSTLDQVGYLDERFGIGMFEDDDYALRLRQAGFHLICAEDVFVHHFGNSSFKKLASAEYRTIFSRNKTAFEEKWGVAWEPHQYRQ